MEDKDTNKMDYLIQYHENLICQLEHHKVFSSTGLDLLMTTIRNVEDEIEKVLGI